jgi:hypothetical protein
MNTQRRPPGCRMTANEPREEIVSHGARSFQTSYHPSPLAGSGHIQGKANSVE